jgi:hypothetical protein
MRGFLSHLPPHFVEGADRRCGQGEIVGQKDERLAGFGIVEFDAPEFFWVALAAGVAFENDCVIAREAGAPINRGGI